MIKALRDIKPMILVACIAAVQFGISLTAMLYPAESFETFQSLMIFAFAVLGLLTIFAWIPGGRILAGPLLAFATMSGIWFLAGWCAILSAAMWNSTIAGVLAFGVVVLPLASIAGLVWHGDWQYAEQLVVVCSSVIFLLVSLRASVFGWRGEALRPIWLFLIGLLGPLYLAVFSLSAGVGANSRPLFSTDAARANAVLKVGMPDSEVAALFGVEQRAHRNAFINTHCDGVCTKQIAELVYLEPVFGYMLEKSWVVHVDYSTQRGVARVASHHVTQQWTCSLACPP